MKYLIGKFFRKYFIAFDFLILFFSLSFGVYLYKNETCVIFMSYRHIIFITFQIIMLILNLLMFDIGKKTVKTGKRFFIISMLLTLFESLCFLTLFSKKIVSNRNYFLFPLWVNSYIISISFNLKLYILYLVKCKNKCNKNWVFLLHIWELYRQLDVFRYLLNNHSVGEHRIQ